MKRLVALLVVALLGFYVAWPAWSGLRIANALSNQDETVLASKVDFPAVRESLRPVALSEISKQIDTQSASLGPLAQVLGGDLKNKMSAMVIEQVLGALVTPKSVIRIANDGGDVAASIEKAVAEAAGKVGGASPGSTGGGVLGQVLGGGAAVGALGGSDLAGEAGKVFGGSKSADAAAAPVAAAPAVSPTATKRSFGLGNVKGFHMAGPLGFDVDVARDATQAKADARIGMSFSGGDWKLTRVVPVL